MESIKDKIESQFDKVREKLGIANIMAVPRIKFIVLSSGIGSIQDKKKRELVYERITRIAGQRPVWKSAKKSIAGFKLREGEAVGVMATLRGDRMLSFLDKFINVVIPRMRDFKGINPKSIDEMGNITIGIREHTVFPETSDEDLRDVFGLSVTIVTSAKNPHEAGELFRNIGLPLQTE